MESHSPNANIKSENPAQSSSFTPIPPNVHLRASDSNSILDNVNSAHIPHPVPNPPDLQPRSVFLRDHVTHATIYPIVPPMQIAQSIVSTLHNEFTQEILRGDTYPMEEPMTYDKFASYWFGTFAAVMLRGKPEEHGDLSVEKDWTPLVLGSFYIKPNYPGRSSHICNAGFLTTLNARGKGVGRLLGEAYLDFAPKLGYTYSVFNLVYETNTASIKIWDALGFKRIGLIKAAGRLRSFPGQLVDAIMYGRDLKYDEDYVSEERFDKIRFYLEKGKYPPSADRSEKSRLRSAATHYRLTDGKLMLKDKEVVSDGQRQYEIAKAVHSKTHGGINKTTANIAEKYHWVRIKETVSQVIRNCAECKEHGKLPASHRTSPPNKPPANPPVPAQQPPQQLPPAPPQPVPEQPQKQPQLDPHHLRAHLAHQAAIHHAHQQSHQSPHQTPHTPHQTHPAHPAHTPHTQPHLIPRAAPLILPHEHADATRAAAVAAAAGIEIPVDPQMMEGLEGHGFGMAGLGVPGVDTASAQHLAAVAAARAALSEGEGMGGMMGGQGVGAAVANMGTGGMVMGGMGGSGVGVGPGGGMGAGGVQGVQGEGDGNKERQLMETLTAELKRVNR